MPNAKKGFTLIELLVVIAIIGILAAIVLVNLSGSKPKARDAERISEIRQIQYALEVYYDTNNHYPECLYVGGSCATTLQNSPAMYNVPKDPSTNINYSYAAFGSGTNCSSYHLGISLEDIKDNQEVLGSDADKLTTTAPTTLCANSAADFSGTSAAAGGTACSTTNGTPTTESCYDVTP